jgi:hypothetical protein
MPVGKPLFRTPGDPVSNHRFQAGQRDSVI